MYSAKNENQSADNEIPAAVPGLKIQPKLSVGAVNDPLEYEADRMADKVMSTQELPSVAATDTGGIQRKCSECEQEEEKLQRKPLVSFIQKKESSAGTVASDAVCNQVDASKGRGANIDSGTQSFMQNRFGADFSDVNIHTDGEAIQMNRDMNAKAFTVGNDIYFNQGQYQPDSDGGKHLLAHELTHTLQQGQSNGIHPKIIQRDLAVEPTVTNPVPIALTDSRVRSAINKNRVVFTDADEIALIRDVIGLREQPAVIDEEFIQMLVQYQADFGLTQDGVLGAGTALRLANELRGEADFMGADADVAASTEMALNPAERRMRLRSRVANRLGSLIHQAFIGLTDNPTGIVSVKTGVDYQTMCGATDNCRNGIQLDYTGSNANNAHWLQFMHIKMFASHPTTRATVFQTGTTLGSGGTLTYSNNTTTNWTVDSSSATDSFYESGFTNERNAGRNTSIFDQPQRWQGTADSYASSAAFPSRPNNVTLVLGFDTHLIVYNRSVYHVRWSITFRFNTSVTPATDIAGTYTLVSTGIRTGLPANLRTALLARYAGSPIN